MNLIEKLVRSTLKTGYSAAIEATLAAAYAQAPWLRLPVIRQVFEFVVRRVGDRIYTEVETHVDFAFIDIEVERERKEYDAALAVFKRVAEEQKGRADEIEKARQALERKLIDLIRFPGKP